MIHMTVTPTSGHATLLRGLQHIHRCNVVIQVSSVPEMRQEMWKVSPFLVVYDSRDGNANSSVHCHVSKQFSITIIKFIYLFYFISSALVCTRSIYDQMLQEMVHHHQHHNLKAPPSLYPAPTYKQYGFLCRGLNDINGEWHFVAARI